MGEVIVMSRPRPAARSLGGESAAILFFTGVRYCRVDEPVATPTLVVGRRRRASRAKKPVEASLVG